MSSLAVVVTFHRDGYMCVYSFRISCFCLLILLHYIGALVVQFFLYFFFLLIYGSSVEHLRTLCLVLCIVIQLSSVNLQKA